MARRGGRKKPPSRRGGGGGGSGDGGSGCRVPYEEKFAEFIRLCAEKKGQPYTVIIPLPEDIGDDYAEMIESLSRLAEAGLVLRVGERTRRRPGEPEPSPSRLDDGKPSGRLPRPNASVLESGGKFSEAGVRGMLINPIYAGVGEFPRMVPDAEWIACVRRLMAEDGPDQFFVNLLYVLRRTFGCVEWGGDLPPDVN